ncbi:MAG: glycosyltransferase family 4 protein [Candidatus Zambryskibacteria bacterium]|nr:glycosyltransferase family 4 protein [Candidatus Zambryskibacteria bacterium]
MSKRILIFSLAYHPVVGGAEIAVKEITNRIKDVEFDIITLRFSKAHLKKEKIGNCTVYRIGGGLGYLSKIFFIPQASIFAYKRKYDAYWAIMTNMLFPIVLMRFLGNRTPYILTLQDGDPFEYVFKRLRIRIFLPLLKYGFRHATKIQTISTYLAGWARQMGYKDEIEVIPNGVDVDRFKIQDLGFKNKDNLLLITTSRLVKKNAVGDIINALKYLPGKVKLRIIGSGPLESDLKKLVKDLKLNTRVEFLGHVSHFDISKCLREADIFVRPSLSEGMGSSFIEAMAAGLPIIATPVGGIPDFLEDGKTGLFCEVNNPQSIAEQVKKLMNDDNLRKNLKENGQKLVREKYDWNLIVRDMKSKVFEKI